MVENFLDFTKEEIKQMEKRIEETEVIWEKTTIDDEAKLNIFRDHRFSRVIEYVAITQCSELFLKPEVFIEEPVNEVLKKFESMDNKRFKDLIELMNYCREKCGGYSFGYSFFDFVKKINESEWLKNEE